MLLHLGTYAFNRLFSRFKNSKTTSESAVKKDIRSLCKVTKDAEVVFPLALYYMLYLCKTSIVDKTVDVRLLYIVSWCIALKYLDEEITVDTKDWARFARVEHELFNATERMILKELGYSLDPGIVIIEELMEKVKSSYELYSSTSK